MRDALEGLVSPSCFPVGLLVSDNNITQLKPLKEIPPEPSAPPSRAPTTHIADGSGLCRVWTHRLGKRKHLSRRGEVVPASGGEAWAASLSRPPPRAIAGQKAQPRGR